MSEVRIQNRQVLICLKSAICDAAYLQLLPKTACYSRIYTIVCDKFATYILVQQHSNKLDFCLLHTPHSVFSICPEQPAQLINGVCESLLVSNN